eukprot:CAMPEP_0113716062 /NCGR_PEP_ID=MMETSP0038_2-20120614/33662_1 /TAXON_ID=2898 /ORGANISM="Cryptomonas paramecium" /LENGTH=164 /DNA_ID=CAMNT_0000643505 /DNA_START=145 /DNA_END=635 /DNA_ORIENTATION=- /assembly_acc=CAM_ASM_000170
MSIPCCDSFIPTLYEWRPESQVRLHQTDLIDLSPKPLDSVGQPTNSRNVIKENSISPTPILQTDWWHRSQAAKTALRDMLSREETRIGDPNLLDELESRDLAFIPASRSESCNQVCATAQHPNATLHGAQGPAMLCRAAWFPAINHCPVLLAGFPEAAGCEASR